MTDTISIPEVVKFLAEETDTTVLQSNSRWSGVTALKVKQGPMTFKSPKTGFHLLELCTGGKQNTETAFDGLNGPSKAVYRPNALFYAPAERVITASTDDGYMEAVQLFFEDSVFQDVAREVCSGDTSTLDLYGFNGRFDPRMAHIVRSIQTELDDPASGSAMMVDYAIQQLAILLMRQSQDVQSRAKAPRLTTLSPNDFSRALDMIEGSMSENIGLNAVADELDISVYNFCRSFKATAGIAPHQYLMERRISTVQDRLQNTKDTLADIAYATGFSSQAHMTTAFKKATGSTPGAYRKEITH